MTEIPKATPDGASAPWDAFTASWSASMDVMSAWAQTWQSLIETRGGPTAELMMGSVGNPAAWPQALMPIMDEIRRSLALPRFADLPRINDALVPSPAASVEMMLVLQQYLGAVMPAWVKACEDFQTEVSERQAKGEAVDLVTDGLDVWNGVLDRTLMAFNRSGDFASLQKKVLRLAMQQRLETRKRAEAVAEALDMPTRSEMVDVYQRLHGLMREVHALRAEIRTLKAQASPSPGA